MENKAIVTGLIVLAIFFMSTNDKTVNDLGPDEFLSIDEALDRGTQMGCPGYHTHTERTYVYYMPCVDHSYYTELLTDY